MKRFFIPVLTLLVLACVSGNAVAQNQELTKQEQKELKKQQKKAGKERQKKIEDIGETIDPNFNSNDITLTGRVVAPQNSKVFKGRAL